MLLLLCNALPAGARATYVPALHDGDTFPDASLVDQRNRPIAFSNYRGSALVVSFFYARCPDRACSLVGAKFAQLARRPASEHIHLLEITLDPGHDTPRVLANYGATFGANPERWTLATGDAAVVAGLLARANVVAVKTRRGFAHSDPIVVLDGQGRLFATLDDAATPEDMLAEARAALAGSADAGTGFLSRLGSGIANVCGGASGISATTALWVFAISLLAGALLVLKLFGTIGARR